MQIDSGCHKDRGKPRPLWGRDSFGIGTGIEPIKMQVSGGHLLTPVRKLGSTNIYLSRRGKDKCKSIPVAKR